MFCRPCVSVLISGTTLLTNNATAQRAGLWESRVEMTGRSAVAAGQECMPAGLPRRAMSQWPANCIAATPTKTASGAFVEAVCQSGNGVSVTIQRRLVERSNREYTIVTTSRIDRAEGAPQILPTSTLRAHYVGGCNHMPDSVSDNRAGEDAGGWTPSDAILWIAKLLGFIGLVYGSIMMWPWMIRRLARSRYEHATVANIMTDQAGAAHIPVLASFSGIRGLPWWYAVATNNAKPLLVVSPAGLDFRVVRRQQRSWNEIECVDVRQAPGTVNFDVTFRGGLLTFGANLGTVPLAAHVLSLIPASVPLSDRAETLKATAR